MIPMSVEKEGRFVRVAPDLVQWQEGPPMPDDPSEDYYMTVTEARCLERGKRKRGKQGD